MRTQDEIDHNTWWNRVWRAIQVCVNTSWNRPWRTMWLGTHTIKKNVENHIIYLWTQDQMTYIWWNKVCRTTWLSVNTWWNKPLRTTYMSLWTYDEIKTMGNHKLPWKHDETECGEPHENHVSLYEHRTKKNMENRITMYTWWNKSMANYMTVNTFLNYIPWAFQPVSSLLHPTKN